MRRGNGSQQVLRNTLLGPSAEETSQALQKAGVAPQLTTLCKRLSDVEGEGVRMGEWCRDWDPDKSSLKGQRAICKQWWIPLYPSAERERVRPLNSGKEVCAQRCPLTER